MSPSIAQALNLEVHEVPDGYIIYQTEHDRVHYLNRTAAVIFEFCNASLDADEVVARMTRAFDLNEEARIEVRASLDSLMSEGLVLSRSDNQPGLSPAGTS